MSRLSERCRREALNNAACRALAYAAADKLCKGQTGGARGRCMDATFETMLVTHCRDVVCPGDPMAVIADAAGPNRISNPYTGSEGGFTGKDPAFNTATPEGGGAAEEGGTGVSPDKIKMYLFVGIGVILLFSMVRKQ